VEIVILCQHCGEVKYEEDESPEPYCEMCLCRRCKVRPNDSGEGYDYLCEDCADLAYLAEINRIGSDFQ
jgi:hypothetical protein